MKSELNTPGALVGSIVLVCLFGGLALAIYPGWDVIGRWASDRDAPAWVQAVGSIGAIVATGAAVHYAHTLQERQRMRVAAEAYGQLLEALFQLVGGLRQVTEKVVDLAKNDAEPMIPVEDVRLMHEELTGLRSALVQFDVTRLDRYALIEAVLVARAVIPSLLRTFEKAIGWSNQNGDTSIDYFAEHARRVSEALEPRVKVLRVAADEFRAHAAALP